MPNFTSTIVQHNGDTFVTVFAPGHDPLPANSEHPNFASIIEYCTEEMIANAEGVDSGINPEDVVDLFNIAQTVAQRFDRLSDRVTVAHGTIYFDGDPVESGLTKQILRFLDEGEDFSPLVNFFEKVQSNPNDHSRTQMYDWLNNHDFTILANGDVLGYKGVRKQADGSLVSGYSGRAIVNGQTVNGHIPNAVGSVVEMPRSEVMHDPSSACSSGLHFGTYRYAQSYASGAMLKVAVNPRDVVSVPTDAGGEKMRCCRYRVLEVIDAPVNTAIDHAWDDDEYEDDGYDLDLDFEDRW